MCLEWSSLVQGSSGRLCSLTDIKTCQVWFSHGNERLRVDVWFYGSSRVRSSGRHSLLGLRLRVD